MNELDVEKTFNAIEGWVEQLEQQIDEVDSPSDLKMYLENGCDIYLTENECELIHHMYHLYLQYKQDGQSIDYDFLFKMPVKLLIEGVK